MEPLSPKLRKALKQAHPDLTDEDIDQTEELLVRRMRIDPEKEAGEIERLDLERAALLERLMPRYREVAQSLTAAAARPKRRPAVKVSVKRAPSR